MNTLGFSHEQLLSIGKLIPEDFQEIRKRRRPYNRLGFAYQLAFVRLTNRFPMQQPFEIVDELLTFVGVQLDIPAQTIEGYQQRRETIAEHQRSIREYLELRRLDLFEITVLNQFLFAEACRLEHTAHLLVNAKQFLREQRIIQPADDTLRRLIATQRQQAREYIYERIEDALSDQLKEHLDALLVVSEGRFSPLQLLKEPPGRPSPTAMLRLIDKLERIHETGVLFVDLTWLNNNYQRSLTRYVRRCSAARLRRLHLPRRHAVLVCFLWQTYRDTIDHIVDMHDKIVTGVYTRAQTEIDEETRRQRKVL